MKVFSFLYYTILYHFVWLTLEILPNHSYSNLFRGFIIGKLFFRKCGKNFMLARGTTIVMARNLSVGNSVYIAHDCWINATGNLSIFDNVIISPKVVIATTRHEYRLGQVQLRESVNKPIVINDGAWICSNCTITMGVEIGKGCIVSANSCVVKSTDSFSLYGSNISVKVKTLQH